LRNSPVENFLDSSHPIIKVGHVHNFYEFESYPAFIDESVDMSEREIGYYVLSAVILLDQNSEATKSLLERDLSLGFKASKHSSQKKHRTLHAFGNWIASVNFMAICSVIPLSEVHVEESRRQAMFNLFEHLNLLGITKFKLDSRDYLLRKYRNLNILDSTVLSYLTRVNPSFAKVELTFHDDHEDVGFAAADYVAWIVRRHINGDGSEFMNYIEDKTEIFQIRCEANRGQPLPLVGNGLTSNAINVAQNFLEKR
jgi:hypothetical protein